MPTTEQRQAPLPQGAGYTFKRTVLGRPLPTAHLAHERLGKPTALAVFASDNLSSVAYATEEILKVSVPVVGAAAFGLLMPITFAILAVLAILLFSYRQTIKAYPSAGGAYVVTKDNIGLLPAQVAGVALLTDYVLTVSVSVAAGVAAIVSAAPSLFPFRVELSIFFIWFIAWGNLRGVRESGRMFAIPTYFFIVTMFTLLGIGLFRSALGNLHPVPLPAGAAQTSGAIGLFLVLHAFASGGAAVTGVEAISNGIPAFRPPEWRNARTTLMWMGSLLGVMFLGLSFLSHRLHVVPTETKTVISQVGRAVFGAGPLGFALFIALQIATTMILILAANTSFADFPRLANFQASDRFMPSQLTKRGHRLVFSNGIVGLAIAATLLVIVFDADVHRLIPLYAIGVFTSFTLSQAGMARRHLRVREPGWRHGLAINGLGAATTAIVTVIIGVTKFAHGAWAIVVFVPVMVWLLVRTNRRYDRERAELDEDLPAFDRETLPHPVMVVPIQELDHKTIHALRYAKTTRSLAVHAVHFASDPQRDADLARRWKLLDSGIPLEIVTHRGDLPSALAWYVSALPPDVEVNVVVPGPARSRFGHRLLHGRTGARIVRALLPFPNARTTLVRDHPVHDPASAPPERRQLVPRPRHEAIVLVDRADRAALRAVRYALSLGATQVRAIHAAVDHHNQERLIRRWMELHVPVSLDVIECWDRNVARSLEGYVVEQMDPRTEITVVLPRRDYAQLRQRVLHDRTSRSIARALGRYEHVDLAVVPYHLGEPRRERAREAPSEDASVGYASPS